eukprot:gene37782-42794_t
MSTGGSSYSPRRDAAILIVDDAPANLSVLRKMMVEQGYQTFVATSGERAVAHTAPPLAQYAQMRRGI